MPEGNVSDSMIPIVAERSKRIETHQKLRESKPYQDELKCIKGATYDFLKAVQACFLMSRRAPDIYDNMLVFRLTDDAIQSAIACLSLIDQGFHNPVRREMRYMIESGVKNLYVDQRKSKEPLEKKLEFLHNEVDRSSISMVCELCVEALGPAKSKEFASELTDFFYKQCAYVHPSKRQIEEHISLADAGSPMGFESVKSLGEVRQLLIRTFDFLLVLIFHGLGLGVSGDVFTVLLDEDRNWKFHKAKYTKVVSAFFDYKEERKTRKQTTAVNSGSGGLSSED